MLINLVVTTICSYFGQTSQKKCKSVYEKTDRQGTSYNGSAVGKR